MKKELPVSEKVLADARRRAAWTRQQLEHKPGLAELLSPEELQDAVPFHLALRDYLQQLKDARIAAGLTLADISARSGIAVESLSRLETGEQTNLPGKRSEHTQPPLDADRVSC